MQPDALAGQQVAVDGLLQQRVPEGVAVGAVGHEHVVRDGLAQGLVELGGRQSPRRRSSGSGTRRPATDADPRDLLDGRREPFQPARAGRRRAARAARPGGTSCWHGVGSGQQLLGVVGVALGAAADVVDERRPGTSPPCSTRRYSRELGAVERGDVETLDPRQPDSSASSGRSGCRRCRSSVR